MTARIWKVLERHAGAAFVGCRMRRLRAETRSTASAVTLKQGASASSSVALRPWAPADVPALEPLVAAYLVDTAVRGGPIPPTEANVRAVIERGLAAAKRGDPCLVAVRDGQIVGWVFGIASDTSMRRNPTIVGFATYVEPSVRLQGIARTLRRAAFDRAAEQGFTAVETSAHDDAWLTYELADGFSPTGIALRRRLVRDGIGAR